MKFIRFSWQPYGLGELRMRYAHHELMMFFLLFRLMVFLSGLILAGVFKLSFHTPVQTALYPTPKTLSSDFPMNGRFFGMSGKRLGICHTSGHLGQYSLDKRGCPLPIMLGFIVYEEQKSPPRIISKAGLNVYRSQWLPIDLIVTTQLHFSKSSVE